MSHHRAFEPLRRTPVPSLNLTVEEYRHVATQARHFHFSAEDTNNVFLVAFLTAPMDSRGVAHILEHTTLCGSRRYPVRDPFFNMLRRSLNTFMNAFTASDWTAYPFASQNPRDFENLMDVYLDAAFFPLLDPLDFAQEGHRLEFERPDDPQSPLVYRGVVFNEMKGAMSSPVRQLGQELQSQLFPTLTYHFNSGGAPEEIPDLTYETLREFHARHYHPSNAVFMTFGSFPVESHQSRIHDRALSRFESRALDLHVGDEQRFAEPRRIASRYAVQGESDTRAKTHVVLGWLLGRSDDPLRLMEAQLLSDVLLDNSACPLRHALETTALGSAPSPLCGLDDSTRETTFACGLEGSEPEHADAVESLVMETLEGVAAEGIPADRLEAALHQLELQQREVGGGRFPYGLQIMMRALPPAMHGADPVGCLDIDPVIETLRSAIGDPGYVKGLVREAFLDNPHRVRLTLAPDPGLGPRRDAAEANRLEAIRSGLDSSRTRALVDAAARLAARQSSEDDPEVLPRVTPADVPGDLRVPEAVEETAGDLALSWYDRSTNGLVYAQIAVDLPALDPDLADDLPIFCDCLTEVGLGESGYLEAQARQAAVCGGLAAQTSARGAVHDAGEIRALFVLAGKALAPKTGGLLELMEETFARARFDEVDRIRELVAQLLADEESSVTDRGHQLAMMAASAGLAPCGDLAHRWSGIGILQRLRALDAECRDEPGARAFSERLVRLRDRLLAAPRRALGVGEAGNRAAVIEGAARWRFAPPATPAGAPFTVRPRDLPARQGWAASTEVSFCARAHATVPEAHAHAPALMVLGPFLTDGFLHGAIREKGGAYGAGAGYDADTGSFRFFSYRDPRVAGTLDDFERSLDWLASTAHRGRALEEAVLRVVSAIDRPESPSGEAVKAFFGTLHGRDAGHRRDVRRAVLDVGLDDLVRAAGEHLAGPHNVAVVSNRRVLGAETGLELHVSDL